MCRPCSLRIGVALKLAMIFGFCPGVPAVAGDQEKPEKLPIRPRLGECTLSTERGTFKAARTQSPARKEYLAGDVRILLDGKNAVALQSPGGAQKWRTVAPDGQHLYWLGQDGTIAYLGGYRRQTDGWSVELDNPPRVRRLELASGKWLPDLPVNADQKPEANQKETVLNVLADPKGVVVLSLITSTEEGEKQGQLLAYRVNGFRRGDVKAIWSKKFRSAGAKPRPGAFLVWAAERPNAASPAIQHLAWLGDDAVLVCAGEVQDILCLQRATGQKRWWFKRIWEEERGFIGPSVWQHLLGSASTPATGDKEDQAQEKKTERSIHGSIIGGPLVVALAAQPGEAKDHRVFVAVARTAHDHFADYLADCVVYEMNQEGSLVAMAKLPRLVLGNRFSIQPDGVVWACQENAFLRIACADHGRHGPDFGMGPGGPDLIARIPWYRQMNVKAPSAWLSSNKAGDPVAFHGGWAVRVPAGGYVVSEAESVCRFPIALVDLKTGLEEVLVLNVPFEGKLPAPKSNYSSDGKHWRTLGPHVLAITDLDIETDRLRVVLAMEGWSSVVDFDMPPLVRVNRERP